MKESELLEYATCFEFKNVSVEKRSNEECGWAILSCGSCYDAIKETWVYEPMPSSRTKDFLAATRFTRENAIELALELTKPQ